MIKVISDEEKLLAIKEKKKLLTVWLILLAIWFVIIATCLGVAIYQVEVHRDRSLIVPLALVFGFASAFFGCFTLFHFAIKYRLTRKYCKMLKDMKNGLTDVIEATFLGYDDTIIMKDGVYFYSMILETKPLRRDDITERKMLVEQSIPKPNLTQGSRLKLISHANILMEYDLLYVAPQKEEQQDVINKSESEVAQNEKTEGENK